ncbi:exo-alpha-sialidase [Candidatus Sumerlaeota bacterium]|nr:exo-alpha-sialidase [Candidatus Sumerlaeota bacterium]
MAEQFARKTIYHSPEKPGYTCWVGAWIMPDKSLMVSFDQATGPLKGRPRAPKGIRDANPWLDKDPQRDFTGLKLANVYLRSTDGGATWLKVAESPFSSPFDRPVFSQSHIGLADGAILRAVDGSQLPTTPDLPRRVYFQRSPDTGKTWGQPEVPPEPQRPVEFLGDYGDGITRVRRLRDGRLIALGAVNRDVIRKRTSTPAMLEPLVLVSGDEGKSWTAHLFLPAEHRKPSVWNEWDAAELPSGDLLCVVRRRDPNNRSRQVRWQGLLKKTGKSWVLEQYAPSTLVHSGHPELLPTREGVILHIATEGIHWTEDGGQTWKPVVFPGLHKSFRPATAPESLRTRYYPKSFQTEDGTIYVFAHNGWDNAYGEFDQSIVMDTFRLAK